MAIASEVDGLGAAIDALVRSGGVEAAGFSTDEQSPGTPPCVILVARFRSIRCVELQRHLTRIGVDIPFNRSAAAPLP